jgi:pyruvate/2-oxoglutarate dehydrogenase complex dihydrolipoamide acyltransferase (E2) component
MSIVTSMSAVRHRPADGYCDASAVRRVDRLTFHPARPHALRIAENMLNSVTQAPHVTAMFECDFTHHCPPRQHKDAWRGRA